MDLKETNTISELKEMMQGLAHKSKDDIRLYKDDLPLEDIKTLAESGFTNTSARAQVILFQLYNSSTYQPIPFIISEFNNIFL